MAYLRSDQSTLPAKGARLRGADLSHIILDVLYPAVAGKLLDGSTSHSGAYGTTQADSFSYYYTDIKGSKPIKDPRIGAYFGSQRYYFRSLQHLDDESALNGALPIFSIDGREFIRISCTGTDISNDSNGTFITMNNTGDYFEVTGYFNAVNLGFFVSDGTRTANILIDGVTAHSAAAMGATNNTPLGGRYVSSASLINIDITSASSLSSDTTLGIHTFKYQSAAANNTSVNLIELIAQDTTSTATKSQIQIPSQNVVSFGKKFTVADTPHYNPFAFAGDGTTAVAIGNTTSHGKVADGWAGLTATYFDSTLDTATSLGLSAWETGGDFYRPVNGGRVVKWVDSSGNIKTSVNMMPPEAHSIKLFTAASGAGTCDPTGTAWTTAYQPTFGNRQIGSNLTTNGTFEADDNWSVQGSNVTSEVRSSDQAHSGTYSWKIVTSGTNSGIVQDTDSMFSVTAGKLYRFRCWVRCDQSTKAVEMGYLTTGCTGRFAVTQFMLHWTTANTWEEMDVTLEATTSGTIRPRFMAQSSNITWWLDDFTVHEIEEPSLQAEVAKTYRYREFGNGSANQGTTSNRADVSQLGAAADDFGFVMDDGLTSLAAAGFKDHSYGLIRDDADKWLHISFIGTGITMDGYNGGTPLTRTMVQNLPYQTHILRIDSSGSGAGSGVMQIDGSTIQTFSGSGTNNNYDYGIYSEVSFHQPKMPPIPEDAVVIADYMLMADFVPQAGDGMQYISKGTRLVSGTRDSYYTNTSWGYNTAADTHGGQYISVASDSDAINRLPAFATNSVQGTYLATSRYRVLKINGSAVSTTKYGTSHGSVVYPTASVTLDLNIFESYGASNNGGHMYNHVQQVANPIHTSSHYQTFETPFICELVGGDRNMEQTNLVVTSDGKTWDEMTRNTDYINNVVFAGTQLADLVNDSVIFKQIHDVRGSLAMNGRFFGVQKDSIAQAYDRYYVLKDGEYVVQWWMRTQNADVGTSLRLSTTSVATSSVYMLTKHPSTTSNSFVFPALKMKRGDYFYMQQESGDTMGASVEHGPFISITKLS